MQATVHRINERGLKEIQEFLAENHKKGGDFFTREMLLAWANEAETHLAAGNPATIEISASDSVNNCTQEFTISDEGIDTEIVELD